MNSIEYTNYIMHHGIKGQKWGVRRFQNEDGSLTLAGAKRYKNRVNEINKLYNKYEKAYGKSIKKVYNNPETGNRIVIYDKKQKAKADEYFKKHQDVFEKTMEELRGTSRSVGLDFVTGKYNLRTVDNTDGKDYWTLLRI